MKYITILLLFCSCTDQSFWCTTQGIPYRECLTDKTQCHNFAGDCFSVQKAYCFSGPLIHPITGQKSIEFAFICTPTMEECQSWREDRRKILADYKSGPCLILSPAEVE